MPDSGWWNNAKYPPRPQQIEIRRRELLATLRKGEHAITLEKRDVPTMGEELILSVSGQWRGGARQGGGALVRQRIRHRGGARVDGRRQRARGGAGARSHPADSPVVGRRTGHGDHRRGVGRVRGGFETEWCCLSVLLKEIAQNSKTRSALDISLAEEAHQLVPTP